MNNTLYFNVPLLMYEHTKLSCKLIMDKIAFVISLKEVLKGKDKLSEEERFSDAVFEEQENLFEKYKDFLLDNNKSYSEKYNLLKRSKIFSCRLLNDIDSYEEFLSNSTDISTTPYYPFYSDKDSFEFATKEFYLDLVYIFRIYHMLCEIEEGMQQYGVTFYLVPCELEEKDDEVSIVSNLIDLPQEEIEKELYHDIIPTENDTEEMQQEKNAIKQLLTYIDEQRRTKK